MVRVDEDDTETDETGCLLHEGEPFTGEVVETAGDGMLVSTYSYFAGYLDGPYQEWRTRDQLRKEGRLRDGRPVGTHREWHANGRLASEMSFDDHSRLLRKKVWDEDGNVTSEIGPASGQP